MRRCTTNSARISKGNNHQEADVNLDIEEKWHTGTIAPQVSFQRREQKQRQPGKQSDNDDALAHHHQRVVS